MDPTSQAIDSFQEEFRAFRDETKGILLLVLCSAPQTGTLAQILRAEEWHPANRSPFLIFDTPYSDTPVAYDAMSSMVVQHYCLLRKGLAKQNILLPEWRSGLTGKEDPLTAFAMHLHAFSKSLREPLRGLWVCWLPRSSQNRKKWYLEVQTLSRLLEGLDVRFVITDEKGRPEEAPVAALGDRARTIEFGIDEKEMFSYFRRLSTPCGQSKPHPGTMPGSARPDVEPPPRPHIAKQPTEDDLREAIQAGKIQSVLLPSQGARLRQLVLDAASAILEKRAEDALKLQKEACALCAGAGAKVEHALMTLILASYYVQFNRPEMAAQKYREAATLAEEARAYPQVAQARMGLAYFLLKAALHAHAAQEYELASDAALKGDAAMLAVEALRMGGACYLQCGRKPDAVRCWQMVVEMGKTATADDLRNSSFKEVCESLLMLLREQKLEDEGHNAEKLIKKITTECNLKN
jgi:tetratricopeptide (TPR) repeat protein